MGGGSCPQNRPSQAGRVLVCRLSRKGNLVPFNQKKRGREKKTRNMQGKQGYPSTGKARRKEKSPGEECRSIWEKGRGGNPHKRGGERKRTTNVPGEKRQVVRP